MKNWLLALGLLCISISAFAQKEITLEDIWQKGTFRAKSVPGFNFTSDGNHFTRIENGKIQQYDLQTSQLKSTLLDVSSIVSADNMWTGSISAFTLSADGTKALLATDQEAIYRHSTKSQYFVYNFGTKQLTRLHDGAKQQSAQFSPDGKKVAFVCQNNLYVKDIVTLKTTAVTKDGKKNSILNGIPDWVYEEEFSFADAFSWSPDGKYIAFLRFDETLVPQFTIEDYQEKDAYPTPITFKYPKVGQPNAVVTAKVFSLRSGKTRLCESNTTFNDYIPRIKWTPDNQLCITTLNRLQNDLKLLLCDPHTGTSRVLLSETNKYYIDIHNNLRFLKGNAGFLWTTERNGFTELWLHDMYGKPVRSLNAEKRDVLEFYGLDEASGFMYYQMVGAKPHTRHVYKVSLDGKTMQNLTEMPGVSTAQFSTNFAYFLRTNGNINSPNTFALCDNNGKVLRMLEENTAVKSKQQEYGVVSADFFQFDTPDKVTLNGYMIQPADAATSGKKYPVLMYVYGGPGSQMVLDSWFGNNYWWFQMLAQQGYIVACVDNRGTGGRGEEFKKVTYLQLGKYETEDQISAAKYLGTLPQVDAARIGIFGWSYGGYMSSLALMKGADVFKTAIAVAPVTNWKWYDSIYTERFMRTEKENAEGYRDNSPINLTDKLKGNYLLVHGLADDNVHFQNSVEMVNKLVANNKQFETMYYPNNNHSIYGANARMHLYKLMTDFLERKLKIER